MDITSVIMSGVGFAVVDAMWQGALVFGLLKLLLLLYPNISSRLKFAVAYTALLSLFAWFVVDIWRQVARLEGVTHRVSEGMSDATGARVFYVETIPGQGHSLSEQLIGAYAAWVPWISILYLAGLVLLTLRLLLNVLQVKKLKVQGVVLPEMHLQNSFSQLLSQLKLPQVVQLKLSYKIDVPMVIGYLRPVVLLPVATVTQLTPAQLEAILVHELAHVKRHDYLLNLLQTVVEIFMFFSPFTWLIGRILRKEREHCCDDMVMEHTKEALPYAQALATLELTRRQPALAMAAGNTKNHLLNRIKRIVEMKKHPVSYGNIALTIALVALTSMSFIWINPAHAQDAKPEGAPVEDSITRKKVIVIDQQGKRTEFKELDELPRQIRKSVEEALDASSVAMGTAAEAMTIADEVVKSIDVSAITREVTQAMSEVDWASIGAEVNREVNKAFAEIDWEEINAEISTAIKEVDSTMKNPAIKAEVSERLRKAQSAARSAEEALKARGSAQPAGRSVQVQVMPGSPAQLNSSTMKAAKALPGIPAIGGGYEGMIRRMERDGIINRSKGFNIKKVDDRLYINGKRQDDAVLARYGRFLNHRKVVIKGEADELTIKTRD